MRIGTISSYSNHKITNNKNYGKIPETKQTSFGSIFKMSDQLLTLMDQGKITLSAKSCAAIIEFEKSALYDGKKTIIELQPSGSCPNLISGISMSCTEKGDKNQIIISKSYLISEKHFSGEALNTFTEITQRILYNALNLFQSIKDTDRLGQKLSKADESATNTLLNHFKRSGD